jgi:cellulose synthase/poly-beta-1,6-N-acetylglucosamine synthase-like glycosyltransferase
MAQETKAIRPTIAILIPCHNEQEMVSYCIDSCLEQTDTPDQIIVVDDGSTDKSSEILAGYGDKITVVRIPVATGAKSKAQQIGLQVVNSDVFVSTDADSILDKNFIAVIRKAYMDEPELAAMAGSVVSLAHNYLTALRAIEYTLGCEIYKRAQSVLNFVLVIPGCAGAFRTELFRSGAIEFEHDTVTEDLDFTYKIHQMGKHVLYEPDMISYTQDPPTLRSYMNQIRRWYSGGWQNLTKHWEILKQPRAALLITMIYFESMLFSVIFITLPFVDTQLFFRAFWLYLLTAVMVGAFAAAKHRRLDLLLWSPLLIPLNFVNAYIFIEQFVEEVLLGRKTTEWYKPVRSELKHKHKPL